MVALSLGGLAALSGSGTASGAAADAGPRAPDPVGVWEYAPPAPWANLTAEEIDAHALSYTPRNPTLSSDGRTPLAFDFRHGDIKVLVLLAEFSDTPHRAANGQSYYNQFVNGNTSSDRSMRSYYYENSYGNFTIIGTVVDWVTLPNTMDYYNSHTYYLARDAAIAANAADSSLDFSQFDLNGDGYVDNLLIIHSGGDEATGCGSVCIWSHSGAGVAYRVDGVYVQSYCTVAEFGVSYGDAMGVLVHEFGHLGLDLPDLYDTSYSNAGLDDWDLMAGGAWDGGGWAPAHLSVWSKTYVGWEEPYDVPFNLNAYTIYPTSDILRHNPIKISTNYTNEYFLVEMRSRSASTRFDTGIPYSGLLIYHVDSNVIANTWERGNNCVECNTNHKGIDIEEDGFQGIDQNYYSNNPSNDVWVSNAAGFGPLSTPNSNLYQSSGNYVSGVKVFNISAVLSAGGPHMTINIDTGRINFGLVGHVVGSAERQVLPTASAVYRVEVTTLAASGDTVSLDVEGANASAGSLDATSLNLPAYGTGSVNLTVTVPSNYGAGWPLTVIVRATSLNDPNNPITIPTLTRVAQAYDIQVSGSLDATGVVPGINRSISLDVRNLGNGIDNVTTSPIFSLSELSMVVPAAPTGEAYFYLDRGWTTSVTVIYNVHTSVPEGTLLPVSLDFRYGPASAPLHKVVYGNITVGKRAEIELEAQVGPLTYLEPGVPKTVSFALHNRGNYFSTVDLVANAPAGIVVVFDVPSVPIAAFTTSTLSAVVTADGDMPAWTAGVIYLSGSSQDGLAQHTTSFAINVSQRYEVLLSGDPAATAAPGTTVAFALLATNFGNGQDQVRLTITPAVSEWNASLSSWNLTLDPAGSAKTANILFTATVPDSAPGNQVQTFIVTLLSQHQGANSSLQLSVVVQPIYSFDVESSAAQTGVNPGETASFLLSFRNTGNVHDTYSVTVSGVPEGWSVDFAEGSGLVPVDPGFTGALTLLLKPPAGAQAGRYDLQIYATSEGDLVQRKIVLESVTVFSHREISVRLTDVNDAVRPGALVTVRIIVENLGNVQEKVFLTAAGAFGTVTFDPLEITVGAYEQATATAFVQVNQVPAGGYGALIVTATSVSDATVADEGTVGINVQAPPAQPTPGLEAVAGALAIAVVAVASVATGARRRKH